MSNWRIRRTNFSFPLFPQMDDYLYFIMFFKASKDVSNYYASWDLMEICTLSNVVALAEEISRFMPPFFFVLFAKLSPSSGLSWAKLALSLLDPAPNPPTLAKETTCRFVLLFKNHKNYPLPLGALILLGV